MSSSGASHFEGNFFGGDYCDNDFEWGDGNEDDNFDKDNSGQHSEDEGDLLDAHSNIDGNGENVWEPPVDLTEKPMPEPSEDKAMENEEHEDEHTEAESSIHCQPIIMRFLGRKAGQVIGQARGRYAEYGEGVGDSPENPYAPFASKIDWEFTKWAKTWGPGSTAMSELLRIEEVREI